MYQPGLFKETRIEVMHALMRAHPFATVVCTGRDGLDAHHLPLLVAHRGRSQRRAVRACRAG